MPRRQPVKAKAPADSGGSNSDPFPLLSLPNELLFEIAELVRSVDTLSMVLTCKLLNAVLVPLLAKAKYKNLTLVCESCDEHLISGYHGIQFLRDVVQDEKKARWPKSLVSSNDQCFCLKAREVELESAVTKFINGCSLIPDSQRQYMLEVVEKGSDDDRLSWTEAILLGLSSNLEELKLGTNVSLNGWFSFKLGPLTMKMFKELFCRITIPLGLGKLHSIEVGELNLEDLTMLATLPSLRTLSMGTTNGGSGAVIPARSFWPLKSTSNVTSLEIVRCILRSQDFPQLLSGFTELKEFSYSPYYSDNSNGLDYIKNALVATVKDTLQILKIDLPPDARTTRGHHYIGSLHSFTKLKSIELNHVAFMTSDKVTHPLTDVLPGSCEVVRLNNVRCRPGVVTQDGMTGVLAKALLMGVLEVKNMALPRLNHITTQNQIKSRELRGSLKRAGVSFSVVREPKPGLEDNPWDWDWELNWLFGNY